MNSGCGINPTTRLFPSTTTMVDRMCVSFSSSRSILYPSSSVSSVTTSVSCRACFRTVHVLGSCPAATHPLAVAGTAERIAAHFKDAGAEPPRFDLTHTAYYLGALVVMSALGWFMNEAWARYGGWVLTLIAIAYAVAFTVAGESLWRKPGLKQPGGLLFTLAVWMTPLAVFGIQYALGWWPREARASYQEYYPQISGSWVVMEAATS